MRLREVKYLLSKAVPLIEDYQAASITRSNQSYFSIEGLNNVRNGIELIKEAGLFPSILKALDETELLKISSDTIIVHPGEGKIIESLLQKLKEVSIAFLETLDSIIEGTIEENSINIKLPAVKDFADLSNVCREFEIIIGQVIINDKIGGEVKITSIENGSIWIEVFLKTTTAVALIAHIAREATNIHSRILYNRILSSKAKIVKIESDRLQTLTKQEQQLIDVLVEVEAKTIEIEFYGDHDNDRMNRIRNSIKMLSELIGKGVEIHPSLNAPKEIASEFPNQTLLKSIIDQIKLLENTANSKDK